MRTSRPLMSVQILLVDPDPQRATDLSASLQHAGFMVTRSSEFQDAMQLVRSTPPDLVITNVRLGAYNGLHLIMRARAEHPQIAAIAMTASHDPVLEADAASFGAEYTVAPWKDPRPFVELVSRLASAEPV